MSSATTILTFLVIAFSLRTFECRQPIKGVNHNPSSDGNNPIRRTDDTLSSAADPWLEPFLPSTVQPISYELWFHPDFYFDRSTFQGRETIVANILADTDTVLVHYRVGL